MPYIACVRDCISRIFGEVFFGHFRSKRSSLRAQQLWQTGNYSKVYQAFSMLHESSIFTTQTKELCSTSSVAPSSDTP